MEMCNGAQLTHKRSGAQAQAKKLIPQIKKGNKGLNENGHEEIQEIIKRKSSQGLIKGN
jgi:hypothetical protein